MSHINTLAKSLFQKAAHRFDQGVLSFQYVVYTQGTRVSLIS